MAETSVASVSNNQAGKTQKTTINSPDEGQQDDFVADANQEANVKESELSSYEHWLSAASDLLAVNGDIGADAFNFDNIRGLEQNAYSSESVDLSIGSVSRSSQSLADAAIYNGIELPNFGGFNKEVYTEFYGYDLF